MTVNDFLSVLDAGIKITITETVDTQKTTLIKFYSEGASQLSTELLARTIDKISVDGKTSLCLHLSEAPDEL